MGVDSFDVVVIGGGLVGLATAYQLLSRYPSLKISVLEKEERVAAHQSGHNSGVIHSGIYYKPGSLKAQNCIDGRRLLIEFCQKFEVPFEICGKIIVATEEKERSKLKSIYQRGVDNRISCSLLSCEQLKEIEPHCAGIEGIKVSDAGVVDFPGVAQKLVEQINIKGGEVRCEEELLAIKSSSTGLILTTSKSELRSKYLINAAGLYSDKVAKLYGLSSPYKIIPFRGEYYKLSEERSFLCRTLIYPVPDPAFPFLGVHLTRGIYGDVECGPNAVLALAKEGYSWGDLNFKEMLEIFSDIGVLKFMARYWKEGIAETIRSVSKQRFVSALQRLVPNIQSKDLVVGPRGVRAQAMIDGRLHDDFAWLEDEHSVHVLNAPSPAATSCLSIGLEISLRLSKRFS